MSDAPTPTGGVGVTGPDDPRPIGPRPVDHREADRRSGGPQPRTPGRGPGLVTAEAVELEIPSASVGLRGLAYVVDLVVLAIVAVAVLWGGMAIIGAAGDVRLGSAAVWVLVTLLGALVIVVPMVVEAVTHGRSLGKLIAKLRVVTVEAAPIGWRHAAIRAASGVLELLATGGLVAFLVSLASPRGQRLGDLVAGTLVVRESVTKADIRPVRFIPPRGTEALVAQLDVAGLDDGDYQVIRTTLLRGGLDPTRHAHLCAVVVESMWDRVSDRPLPTGVAAPAVLTAIAAAYQQQHTPAGAVRATDWVWAGH